MMRNTNPFLFLVVLVSIFIGSVFNPLTARSASVTSALPADVVTYSSISELYKNAANREQVELRCKLVVLSTPLGTTGILVTDGTDFMVLNCSSLDDTKNSRGAVLESAKGEYFTSTSQIRLSGENDLVYSASSDESFIPEPTKCDVANISKYSGQYVLIDNVTIKNDEISGTSITVQHTKDAGVSGTLLVTGWINRNTTEIYCDRIVKSKNAVWYDVTVSCNNPDYGTAYINESGNTSTKILDGDRVVLTAVENEGYKFVRWEENGVEVGVGNPLYVVPKNTTGYTAIFAPLEKAKHMISASVGTGKGTATVNGQESVEVEEGAEVTLQATPAEGYNFVNWTSGDDIVSTESQFSVACTGAKTYVVNFAAQPKPKYTISAAVGNGDGTATVNGEKSVEVEEGTEVTLQAIPSKDYDFVNWTSGDEIVSTEVQFSVVCTGAKTYVANFAAQPKPKYTISASLGTGEGTATVNGQESVEVEEGAEVTLQATPAEGYNFVNWTSGGDIISTHAQLNVGCTGAKTYVANFAAQPKPKYAISASIGTGKGTATVNGQESVEVEEGAEVTLQATPAEGYNFVNWTSGGDIISTHAQLNVACTGAKTYVANFAAQPKPKYIISVAVGSGEGTATVNGQESVEVEEGTEVTLQAIPAEGYDFDGWYDESSQNISVVPEFKITVSGNSSYSARFAKLTKEYTSFVDFMADAPKEQSVIRTKMVVVGIYLDDIYTVTDGTQMMIMHKYESTATSKPLIRGQVLTSVVGQYRKNSESHIIWYSSYEAESEIDEGLIPEASLCEITGLKERAGEYVKLSPVKIDRNGSDYTVYDRRGANPISAKGDVLDGLTDLNGVNYTISGLVYLSGDGLYVDKAERYNVQKKTYKITVKADAAMGKAYIGVGGIMEKECEEGIEQGLYAEANEGYLFIGWRNGDKVISTDNPYRLKPESDAEYEAVFEKVPEPEIPTYVISVSVGTGSGAATVNGVASAEVQEGVVYELKATPAEGYSFVNWTSDGVVVGTTAQMTVTCAGTKSYVANFAELPKSKYTISVSVVSGKGSATVNGQEAVEVEEGTDVTLQAVPAEGYNFVNWTSDGVVVGMAAQMTVTCSGAKSYEANFVERSKPVHTISVSVGTGNGIATVNGVASAEVQEGIVYELQATPAEGYSFVNWTSDGAVVGTTAQMTATCSGAKSYVANFVEIPKINYTVSVSVGSGEGMVTVNGQKSVEVEEGTEVTLLATPSEGYDFDGWYDENDQNISVVPEFKVTVNGNISYSARFVKRVKEYASFAEFIAAAPKEQSVIRTKIVVVGVYLEDIYTVTDGKDMMHLYKLESSASKPLVRGQILASVTGQYHENKEMRMIRYTALDVKPDMDEGFIPEASLCEITGLKEKAGEYVKLSPVKIDRNGSDYTVYDRRGANPISAKGDVLDGLTNLNGVNYTISGLVYLSGEGLYVDKAERYNVQKKTYKISVKTDAVMGKAYIGVDGVTEKECEEGIEQSLYAEAKEGYLFIGWRIGDKVISTDNPYRLTPESDAEYEAAFEKAPEPAKTYNVSVAIGDGQGSVTVNGRSAIEVEDGVNVILKAIPSEGYEFVHWKNGDEIVGTDAEMSVIVESDAIFTAYFALKRKTTYTISVSVGSGKGTADVDGNSSVTVEAGKNVVLTAKPAEGYIFDSWVADGKTTELEAISTVEVNANVAYVAMFKEEPIPVKQYTISVRVGSGKGKVSVNGTSESVVLDEGETALLSAAPDSDYEFSHWMVGTDSVSKSNPYMVLVTSDIIYDAVFKHVVKEKVKYPVQVTSVAGGKIKLKDATGAEIKSGTELLEGSVITVDVQPELGFRLSMIVVNDNVIAGNTFVLGGPTTVSAIFTPDGTDIITLKVESSNSSYGKAYILPDKVQELRLASGRQVEIEAVPEDGYMFEKWLVDGVSELPDSKITVAPKSSVTYTAVFKRDNSKFETYNVMIAEPQHGKLEVSDRNGRPITNGSELASGSIIFVKAVADMNYVVESVLINGKQLEGENFELTEDVTISAVFAYVGRNKVKIEVSTTDEQMGEVYINSSPTRSLYVEPGDEITLYAIPVSGVKFVEWRKNGERFSLVPEAIIRPTEEGKYEAVFDYIIQKSRPVAVVSSNPEKGRVRIVGESVLAISTRKYLTLEATPMTENDYFECWTDQTGAVRSKASTFVYSGEAGVHLTANFRSRYKVEFNSVGDGFLGVVKPDGENLVSGERVNENTTLRIQTDPNEHYDLQALKVNGVDIKRNAVYDDYKISVSGPTNIEAVFSPKPYKIRIANCEHGSIEIYTDLYGVDVERHKVASGENWPYPTTLYIFAIPEEGYEVESITHNDVKFGQLNDFNGVKMAFIVVDGTLNIGATFKLSSSGINDIVVDDAEDGVVRYYDMKGVEYRVDGREQLPPGIYVRRGTRKSEVILVR